MARGSLPPGVSPPPVTLSIAEHNKLAAALGPTARGSLPLGQQPLAPTMPIKEWNEIAAKAGPRPRGSVPLATEYNAALLKNNPQPTVEPTVEPNILADVATPIHITAAPVHKLDPLPNILHNYPSYTYGISLHVLSADEYNKTIEMQSYVPKHVLIASAGRRDNIGGTFPRSEFFNEDFYFTNLNMTTVIGLNARSRATNAITLNFSINEPYGITLLNRIIDVAHSLSAANYIDMPYLLQIDFFGINDAGEIIGIIPGITKYIPIQLIKMDIKTGINGTEYAIQAVPFNHSAYDISTISTPANFEVTASSVQSFFDSSVLEIDAMQLYDKQRAEQTASIERAQQFENNALSVRGPNFNPAHTPILNTKVASTRPTILLSSDPVEKIKSYTGAINAHQFKIGKQYGTVVDTYTFEIHDEIKAGNAGSFSLKAKNLDVRNTAMANENTANTNRQSNADISIKQGNFASDAKVFSINTGTSIDVVINYVMKSSNFIQSQMKVPEDPNSDISAFEANKIKNSDTTPLRWFKIIPQITLGKYDTKQHKWARIINYKIIPYDVYNTKTDEAPQGTTASPAKVYNYYHTGKNTDILNLDIEFNCMYYTAITAYKSNASQATSVADDKFNDALITPSAGSNPNAVMPMRKKYEIAITKASSGAGITTPTDIAVQDTEQSLLPDASADMLQIKLKIIGDPLFIKQDDLFYAPRMTTAPVQVDATGDDNRLTANGSFTTDTGEVYVQVSFRSPSDIDDVTGMMKYDPNYQESVFSGMYRVVTVDNSFTGGQFTQTLDLVRLHRQEKYDYTTKGAKINQKSQDENRVAVANQTTNTAAVVTVTNSSNTSEADATAANSNPIVDTPVNKVASDQQKLMALTRAEKIAAIAKKYNANVIITPLKL